MELKDYFIVAVIVLVISLTTSFLGASPFSIINGEVVLPDDTPISLNLHYAEGFYQNYTTPLTITIAAADTYYNITGFSINNLNGIYVNGNNAATIARSGAYKIDGTMSFRGGNAGEYEVELFVNGVGQPHCTFFRTTSSNALGDASMSCIETLSKGDYLQMKIKDLSAPAQNVLITALNFNIFEIP